jgi:hypothetical protein
VSNFVAAPYSKVSATSYAVVGLPGVSPTVRVYFQDETNKLREVIWNQLNGWTEGFTGFPTAIPGTSLSALSALHPDGTLQFLRLFFQQTNTTVINWLFDGAWSQGMCGFSIYVSPAGWITG